MYNGNFLMLRRKTNEANLCNHNRVSPADNQKL
jgi:hypothetical protein